MRRTKVLVAAVLSSVAPLGLMSSAGAAPGGVIARHSAGRPALAADRAVSTAPYPSLATCRGRVKHQTYQSGVLTVATDNPAYAPWFEHNTPSNGKGFESAVAYAVASLLGFKKSQVKWVTETFNNSYAPGPKAFDFDINEVSITPARAKAVTFSVPYYKPSPSPTTRRRSPSWRSSRTRSSSTTHRPH